jgi:predicted transcriptional regulator
MPEARLVEPAKAEEDEALKYPKIPRTNQCSEAIVSLLSTEWGKTPRPIRQLREAMEANAVFFPKTTLSGVLVWLVKKGQLRRWKDKKRGYLYVVNEPEAE